MFLLTNAQFDALKEIYDRDTPSNLKNLLWRWANHLRKIRLWFVVFLLYLPSSNVAFANDECRWLGSLGEQVENILIMPKNASRMGIQLPKQYWEIYSKMIGGYEDISFHFRLDMETLAPVSKRETLDRKNQGRWDYLSIRIAEMTSLEEIALGFAKFGAKEKITEIPRSLGKVYGFEWLDTEGSSISATPINDIFVSRDERGHLNAVIQCDPPLSPDLIHTACQHYFFTQGIGVQMYYFRQYIDNAMIFQRRVDEFVSCATNKYRMIR